ncbi:ParB/RepB/Spo0J family partition protein [Streptomyces sp. NPDC096057]|uniref:ParB/RepB/Spo0J family partition protein n=1 Tax=Streptomyces sp. NPDC096057 TaxID=3155543 RepID=UPI003330AE96
MSKADQLGAGRFAGGARPVSARRTAIGAATGVPTEGVAPPARLPVKRISPNPENPRTSVSDLTELASSLKEHGQKAAITVMNRDAYVRANPTRAGDLEPDTTHVVVDGSSRLAAARAAGLTHLNVMVDDEQGSDGDSILESALVANIHRNDLDPLDEARALQRLLTIHGSQVKLAKRLHKSQGWVSQRLALLNLAPELQAVVGEEPVEFLRSVAKVPQDRQEAALQELKDERARKEATKKKVPTASDVSSEDTGPEETKPKGNDSSVDSAKAPAAVLQPTPAAKSDQPDAVDSSKDDPDNLTVRQEPTPVKPVVPASRPTASVPATRTPKRTATPSSSSSHRVPSGSDSSAGVEQGSADAKVARHLPYDDGMYIAMHLIQKMSDSEFDKMLSILNKHQHERPGSQTTAR